jgi:pectate lyase
LEAVRAHCDKVLAIGRDVYGPKPTPLFVDGLDVESLQPPRWRYGSAEWILVNLANQQNLLRTLCGLSALTGDGQYKQAAIDAMRYGIENLRSPSGLLYWGGHAAYDALSEEWVGRRKAGDRPRPWHELMNHLPYYELMHEIDPDYTAQFLGALWSAHVLRWSKLDIDQHAELSMPLPPPDWDTRYLGGPVFFQGEGRSFVSIADDLIYAACMLYRFSDNEKPLLWAKRLAHRYIECRDPNTGLSGSMFSHREEVDRAQQQFAGALPGHVVTEATLWSPYASMSADLVWMMLGQECGPACQELGQWAMEDLRAIAQVGYDPRRKVFQGLLIDGANVENVRATQAGYFGDAGAPIRSASDVLPSAFCTYALAARISRDPFFWDMARQFAQVRGLGDIAPKAGDEPALSPTDSTEAAEIVGLIHLHHLAGRSEYLDQACRIADNILARKRVGGLFVDDPDHRYARLDSPDALVLLNLCAAMTEQEQAVPAYWFGSAYFACEWENGRQQIYDTELYAQPRGQAASQPESLPRSQDRGE